MASNTDYLPDEITYGFVADRVLLAIGDTASDDNRYPDGVPAQGTVRFSPERTILYTQQHPATVLPQDIECTIYHRDHPVAINNGYEPERVGELVDPAGHVGNVALIVGWYEVVYLLSTGTAQRFRFQVKPEHTNDNPLWLPSVAPLTPTPSERFVVNEQVYNDTKTARDEAVGAAVTAVEARTGAETARDQAGTHATNSAASASTAADILAASQALGITVDTSVGTRVYVGDTMIHGDTGWRDMREHLIPGILEPVGSGGYRSFQMQRVNSTVNFQMRVTVGEELAGRVTTSPISFLEGLPLGLTQSPPAYSSLAEYTNRSSWLVTVISNTGLASRFDIYRAGDIRWSLGETIFLYGSYHTTNPWPTSLPGVPA